MTTPWDDRELSADAVEWLEERAAHLEHDAGFSRPRAESNAWAEWQLRNENPNQMQIAGLA